VFYLWPLLVAAYFLGRREVAANFAFMAAACAVALALWVEPVLRVAMLVAVLAIVGVVTGVIVVLREQVLALVGRLRMLASHDSLAGALNRGAFEQRLDAEMARTERTRVPLPVRSPSRSASPRRPRAAAAPGPCSPTPTARCTRPSAAAATASSAPTRGSRRSRSPYRCGGPPAARRPS
jgi:hypothetical protein